MSQILKAVIFDFDMTLADSCKTITYCMAKVADEFNLPVPTYQEIMSHIGLGGPELWEALWGESKEEWNQYYFHNLKSEENARMELFPGVTEMLQNLQSRGLKLGVASNRTHPAISVDATGISHFMDVVVGLADCKEGKPAPDMLLLAAQTLGVTPSEAIYVGDTQFDIDAANSAGMKSVAVLTSNPKENLSGAWRYCNSILDLPTLLEKENLI